MTRLHDRVVARIQAHGPMPFAAFMATALYDRQDGYYARHARTGWGGHFVTSPEIDGAFGALWGRLLRDVWMRAGAPVRFDLVEIGPGEGGFARALLDEADDPFTRALHLTLVEQSGIARARQRERLGDDARVSWVASVDEAPLVDVGCVFANEVLDNLPVHVIEMTADGIAEVFVSVRDGELAETLGAPSTEALAGFVARHGIVLVPGHRIEVSLAAESFVRRATSLVQRGTVTFVDYGATSDELVLRPAGTLTCYSSSGADAEPLVDPGDKDITAHVNWTSIVANLRAAGARVTGPVRQSELLRALGIGELDRDLHQMHAAAIQDRRGVDAVAALSRRNALRVLLDPSGLGGLQAVIGWRGMDPIDIDA